MQRHTFRIRHPHCETPFRDNVTLCETPLHFRNTVSGTPFQASKRRFKPPDRTPPSTSPLGSWFSQ